MLSSKLFQRKTFFTKPNSETVRDLVSSTFKFPEGNQVSGGVIAVSEFEAMRADLISLRMYSDHNNWDAILKYNGISNPFSINAGQILQIPVYNQIAGMYKSPLIIQERGEKEARTINPIVNPVTDKDKKRIENIERKVGEALPPNISKKGDKSVKIKDGKLIFGEDVTTVNKENCPVPISRARLQNALLKNKLF